MRLSNMQNIRNPFFLLPPIFELLLTRSSCKVKSRNTIVVPTKIVDGMANISVQCRICGSDYLVGSEY